MHNETTPSLSAWSSLLAISTRFEMNRIRSRAIAEVLNFRPRIDPVDQVVLAVKHDIPEWFPLGYAALCQREEAIEVEEAKKLGLETTVMLAKAREVVRKTSSAVQPSKHSASFGEMTPPPTGFFNHVLGLGQTSQIQATQDPAPFDTALVSRVVNEIFWPTPVLSEAEESSSEVPETPSPELANTPLPVPDSWKAQSAKPSLRSSPPSWMLPNLQAVDESPADPASSWLNRPPSPPTSSGWDVKPTLILPIPEVRDIEH